MADDVNLAAPAGVAAADEIAGKLYQKVKLGWGPPDTFNEVADVVGKEVPVKISSTQMGVLGQQLPAASVPVVPAYLEYKTIPASAVDSLLGASGALNDFVEALICVVAIATTSQVTIKDGNGSPITVLPNQVGGGVGTYYIPLGLACVVTTTPGWRVSCGAGVSVIATGNFT